MATTQSNLRFAEAFEQKVAALLQAGIAAIVDEEVAEAQKRVDQRVREMVARKAISAASFAEVMHQQQGLVIRIINPDERGPR